MINDNIETIRKILANLDRGVITDFDCIFKIFDESARAMEENRESVEAYIESQNPK